MSQHNLTPIPRLHTDNHGKISIQYHCLAPYRLITPDPLLNFWSTKIQNHFCQTNLGAGWNWHTNYRNVSFIGRTKSPKLYAIIYDTKKYGFIPAGLIAVLEDERWPFNHSKNALFCWYLAAAHSSELRKCVNEDAPKGVGGALLDFAIIRSHISGSDGRVWLHADPLGGNDLTDWYKARGMTQVPKNIVIPGFSRHNDRRYMYYN